MYCVVLVIKHCWTDNVTELEIILGTERVRDWRRGGGGGHGYEKAAWRSCVATVLYFIVMGTGICACSYTLHLPRHTHTHTLDHKYISEQLDKISSLHQCQYSDCDIVLQFQDVTMGKPVKDTWNHSVSCYHWMWNTQDHKVSLT